MPDHRRREHPEGVHRLDHVVAQLGQLVRRRPVAATVTARVEGDHPEPGEPRCRQRPVVGVGAEPVQQHRDGTVGATPLPVAQSETARGGQLVAYDGSPGAHDWRL